jgi:unsaturated rhamnogalacturonyl hydrolase
MKRIVLLALCCLAACAPKPEPYSVRMVRSEIKRAPEATFLDGQEGNYKWNYTTGLELRSFVAVSLAYDIPEFDAYVRAWYDGILNKYGLIQGKYDQEKYNLDHICPARTLISLYQQTPDKRYSAAIEEAREQLRNQPRTEAGAFWHKKVYPGQVWLDGLYMAEPFYATYAAVTHETEAFDDIALQFKVAAEKTYDPATGLYRHAWDETRQMFWADPATGQSAHCWGRALGWYTMALEEVIPFFPEDHPGKAELQAILEGILATLPRYADPETGMWYQVLDCPGREGNYLESTCSAMFTYAYLKAARMGWAVPESIDPRALYDSLVKTFIREDADGTLNLTQCCAVAGLGGKENRSGTFDYYIHEKITENDPKGIGPFIWASLEYENK